MSAVQYDRNKYANKSLRHGELVALQHPCMFEGLGLSDRRVLLLAALQAHRGNLSKVRKDGERRVTKDGGAVNRKPAGKGLKLLVWCGQAVFTHHCLDGFGEDLFI